MSLSVNIIQKTSLDKKSSGIASYIRTFVRNTTEIKATYWGGDSEGTKKFGENSIKLKKHNQGLFSKISPTFSYLFWLVKNRSVILSTCDILFIHQCDWALPFVQFPVRKPIVMVMHGWNPREIATTLGYFRFIWLRLTEFFSINIATKVILVSKEGFNQLCEKFPSHKDKFIYIPTFIDDLLFPDDIDLLRKRNIMNRVDLDSPKLVCVSRLSPEKQISKSIELISKLQDFYENPQLTIIGSGPLLNELKCISRKYDIRNNINFLGEIPRKQIGNYLLEADFFILFSVWEGTSIALLEALAHGVPSIVTDIADHKLMIDHGKNGFLVDRNNIIDDALDIIIKNYPNSIDSYNKIQNSAKKFHARKIVPIIEDLMNNISL